MFIVTAMVWLAAYTVLTAVNALKDWMYLAKGMILSLSKEMKGTWK